MEKVYKNYDSIDEVSSSQQFIKNYRLFILNIPVPKVYKIHCRSFYVVMVRRNQMRLSLQLNFILTNNQRRKKDFQRHKNIMSATIQITELSNEKTVEPRKKSVIFDSELASPLRCNLLFLKKGSWKDAMI